ISAAVTHRAQAGLLAVDLRNGQEVRDAHHRLTTRAKELGVTLDGLYVQHMEGGRLELLVSALRDPIFGVILTCGAGGNFTEMIDDVVLERAPVDETLALDMLERLRIVNRSKQEKSALLKAADFIARFSRIAAAAPWKRFVIEIN